MFNKYDFRAKNIKPKWIESFELVVQELGKSRPVDSKAFARLKLFGRCSRGAVFLCQSLPPLSPFVLSSFGYDGLFCSVLKGKVLNK